MTISPTLLQFLKELAQNNNRDWFADNKERYLTHQQFMKEFVGHLKIAVEQHDLIEQAKLYRIYRDVRFSKNKAPYKSNFGGWLKRATHLRRGGYYFHIEPNNTMIAGGFWRPNPKDLKRIREEIGADDQELRSIIAHPTFQKTFNGLEGEVVKTSPRGYKEAHPAIDLIRKKQFVVRRSFSNKEVLKSNFFEEVVSTFKNMRPFFDYMSDILTTDANGLSLE